MDGMGNEMIMKWWTSALHFFNDLTTLGSGAKVAVRMASSNGGKRRWRRAPELLTGQPPASSQGQSLHYGVVKTCKPHFGFIASLSEGDVFFSMTDECGVDC